jgi:hypothetical protein
MQKNKMLEEKIIAMAEKMGMDKDMINENMIMAMQKTIIGSAWMGKIMMDKGMSEKDIMDMMKKLSDMMMDKDMMMEIMKIKEEMFNSENEKKC